MNPSFPGSSGDRHPPPQQQTLSSSTSALNKSTPSSHNTHPFHSQPPLTQLAHAGHHTTSLHPLHGGSHGSHTGSILHSGPPPPLPPPPLTSSLGSSSNTRSPHHSLSGSILHPPRASSLSTAPGGSSAIGKGPGGAGGVGNAGPSGGQGSSSASVMMGYGVRMPSQNATQTGGSLSSGGPGSSGVGLTPAPAFSIRPGSPRRGMHDSNIPSTQQLQSQPSQPASTQKYVLERTSEADDYHQSKLNNGPIRQRELRVEDALLYLDQVKQQFGDQPDIYNQFLDVMKDFKAQTIDTPGVIVRVSNLFRGYPNLILGFNTFLPPGYRIRPDTSIEVIPQPSSGRGAAGNQPSIFSSLQGATGHPHAPKQQPTPRQSLPSGAVAAGSTSSSKAGGAASSKQSATKKAIPAIQTSSAQGATSTGGGGGAAAASGGGGGGGTTAVGSSSRSATNPVEFDHAIHYVTTIKQRFADEPETYKAFLEILHTYQKEQRSIRQVLDQVSFLFRDHPDLLREFTFFLPDAVQEQAKERLNRAAEKAQLRKDRMGAAGGGAGAAGGAASGAFRSGQPTAAATVGLPHAHRRDDVRNTKRGGGHDGGDASSPSVAAMKSSSRNHMSEDHHVGALANDKVKGGGGRDQAKGHASPRDVDDLRRSGKMLERREKDRERDRNKALFAHKRSKRRSYDGKERRDYMALSDVVIDKDEWGIFERIKKILPSRDNWREFLKCLELYSQEVLGRAEMLSLIKNLFGRHTELVQEFDHLLCTHGEQKCDKEMWPFIPLAETDLSQCRRATPSYRLLPASYPIPPCSYRSKLEKSVCNDSWVSVPTGSEDFSFKNMRKNQYEEALFKCEDERFEIDMVIDANASTISVLEPLAREIDVLTATEDGVSGGEEKLWNYVVDKGTFRVTHLNAITRVYGEAGGQILDLLRKYPAGAIPVILKRLKQKDDEWRRARQDLNKQWKDVNEKNYHKSLDHSSFYFKQKDKKQTSNKVLLAEAKKKLDHSEKMKQSLSQNDASVIVVNSPVLSDQKAPPQASEIADALKKEQESANSNEMSDVPVKSESLDVDMKDKAAVPSATTGGSIETEAAAAATTPASVPWKPHFMYKIPTAQIHKDAYGLLTYAAEKNLSSSDKEKVSKVWQAFFFPFFQLDEEWLTCKPKRKSVSLERAKSLRVGTEVSTDFGDGTINHFDREKGVHVVNLPIAQAFLQPDSITIQEQSVYPPNLCVSDEDKLADAFKATKRALLYGTQYAYAFMRLYQMLHNRLERAFELCEKAKRNRYRRTINPAARALAHARHLNEHGGKEKTGDYQAFLSKLYALIDGSVDSSKYEDCCRSLMGSTSYFLFTMDKLVSLILKQMQHLATDETCQELQKCFTEYIEGDASTTSDAYLHKTKTVFEGEGAFRIEYFPGILRQTPLEPRLPTPSGGAPGDPFGDGTMKIWAPSPRLRQQEPSKWLVEPELAIEYLGNMDGEGGGDEDDDGDESPSATPPETPIATPLSGSPVREPAEKKRKKESQPPPPATTESGDSSDAFTEDEDERKDPVLPVLKKRARSNSVDVESSRKPEDATKKPKINVETSTTSKVIVAETDAAQDDEDEEEGEVQDDDDPMTGDDEEEADGEAKAVTSATATTPAVKRLVDAKLKEGVKKVSAAATEEKKPLTVIPISTSAPVASTTPQPEPMEVDSLASTSSALVSTSSTSTTAVPSASASISATSAPASSSS